LSGPTAIHDATVAARDFAQGADVNEDDAARLAIIVEELVTNLYDHGGLTPKDTFEIRLSARPDDLIFVLMAPGTPFDPRQPAASPAADSRGGGAGLKLLRAWSGQIDHQYVAGRNEVAVVLPRRTKD
jgi:anti-sigma regulatory factor (Ser/Thr protein kinase)